MIDMAVSHKSHDSLFGYTVSVPFILYPMLQEALVLNTHMQLVF